MARLGRTELDVYPLGLGGIPLMRISDAEARAIVAAATSGGINFADTAEGYGESEARLAAALQPDRDGFIIAMKPVCGGNRQGRQLGEQFCRQCGYCVPCPSSVPIPRILWLDNYHRRYGERDPSPARLLKRGLKKAARRMRNDQPQG